MVDTMYLEFDNPKKSYFPGEVVRGRVIWEIKRTKQIKGLSVYLAGAAIVRFKKIEKKKSGKVDNYIEALEELVVMSEDLIVDYTWITLGRNEFPFAFELPMGIPSSFAGEHGEVAYQVLAELDRKSQPCLLTQSPFTVNAFVDLNLDYEAHRSLKVHQKKDLRCMRYFNKGSVAIMADLKKQGVVPGEELDIVVRGFNYSTHDFVRVEIRLYQMTTYFAQGKSESSTTLMSKVKIGCVHRGNAFRDFENRKLVIPSVPPSGLGASTLIHVDYQVVVSFRAPHARKAIVGVTLPIIIGTIPLQANFQKFLEYPAFLVDSGRQFYGFEETVVALPSTAAILSGYDDLPMVSFKKARVDAAEEWWERFIPPAPESGQQASVWNSGFKPQYAVYTWKH